MSKHMRSPTPMEVAYATRLAMQGMNKDLAKSIFDKHKAFAVAMGLIRSIGAKPSELAKVALGIATAVLTLETMEHDYTEHWLANECKKLDEQMRQELAAEKAKEN